MIRSGRRLYQPSIESIVDLVGMRLGMNCGPMLPLMPTTETL